MAEHTGLRTRFTLNDCYHGKEQQECAIELRKRTCYLHVKHALSSQQWLRLLSVALSASTVCGASAIELRDQNTVDITVKMAGFQTGGGVVDMGSRGQGPSGILQCRIAQYEQKTLPSKHAFFVRAAV